VSFRRLLDRTVTLVPTVVDGEDAHGNDRLVEGAPIAGIPAARDPLDLFEQTGDTRDAQGLAYVYLFPATHEGVALAPTGYDRIVDGDDTFEIRGAPDEIVRRRGGKIHHIEAIAYLAEGLTSGRRS